MVELKSVKRITVTEQIMEQIARLIREGQWKGGDRLPNERELAARLGVTRGRVREALRALSLIGLITIKAGEGSFVNHRDDPIPEDTVQWMFHHEMHNLEEVYAARRLIETEVYATAAVQLNESDLKHLKRLLEDMKQAIDRSAEPEAIMQTLDEFDLTVGERCGNQIYNKLMQTVIHLRRETSLRILAVPGSTDLSFKSRQNLWKALSTGDPLKVKSAMDAFFDTSEKFYHRLKSKD